MKRQTLLLNMFSAMLDTLGPSRWWPADSPFEMAVGAILTQNTNWGNVERAIANLKNAGVFSPRALHGLPDDALAELIRPAGYFRLKAGRIKHLLAFINDELGGDITALGQEDMASARERLLAVKGVGPETADSILLYGLGLPSFVADKYTARICSRHGWLPEETGYEELREFFMDALPPDVALFNEFHALLVRVGNGWCRPRVPRCEICPLSGFFQ